MSLRQTLQPLTPGFFCTNSAPLVTDRKSNQYRLQQMARYVLNTNPITLHPNPNQGSIYPGGVNVRGHGHASLPACLPACPPATENRFPPSTVGARRHATLPAQWLSARHGLTSSLRGQKANLAALDLASWLTKMTPRTTASAANV